MTKQSLALAGIVGTLIMAPLPAQAYLDPGTGSMFLQLLLGGVAGLAVLLKLYWQRFLSFFGLGHQESDSAAEGEIVAEDDVPASEPESETEGQQH